MVNAMLELAFSEIASKELKELIERPNPETGKAVGDLWCTHILVSVAGGGCSVFKYSMAPDRNVHEGDEGEGHFGRAHEA